MIVTANDDAGRWVPAPGSVARRAWPLPARWLWWLLHRPALALVLVLVVGVAMAVGPAVLAAGLVALAVALVVWWRVHPVSFDATAGRVLLGIWRSGWAYGARWRAAMMLSGLGGRFDGDEYLPRVVRVRAGKWADRVVVRIVSGQQPADWARRADALTHAFGARSCQVRETGRAGYLELRIGRRDPLAAVVPATPIAEPVNLDALPIGRREDGHPWTVRLEGAHVLVAGATGAGKGSVLWSLIRAVAPAVRDGLVQLRVLDPKGGMELAAGAPMFEQFACDSADDLATALEDAVEVMNARAARLRGITRKHTPSTDEPLIVVVVDELASLTAYADRDERKRINSALPKLISKGRAVGVVVVGALQDPRKEIIPFRDLIPTRIALAMVEADQTDYVLGKGARRRGADCSRIPLTQPGTAWVWCDGESEPTRVRASWVSDDDIAAMAADYTPRGSASSGQVVDLPPPTDDDEAGAA